MGLINIKCHHDDQIFRNKCYNAIHLLLEDKRDVLPLPDFIQMFDKRHNDNMDEHLIRTMKHAIEVLVLNNIFLLSFIILFLFQTDSANEQF